MNIEKLERLYLYNNKIADISIFGKLNLSNLLELCMDNNAFKDISVLEKAHKSKILERVLETEISDSVYESIKELINK